LPRPRPLEAQIIRLPPAHQGSGRSERNHSHGMGRRRKPRQAQTGTPGSLG